MTSCLLSYISGPFLKGMLSLSDCWIKMVFIFSGSICISSSDLTKVDCYIPGIQSMPKGYKVFVCSISPFVCLPTIRV